MPATARLFWPLLAALFLLISACGDSGMAEARQKADEMAARGELGSRMAGPLPGEAEGTGDPIRIVGSSTVSPFTKTVAEQFGAASDFPTPIVETTGTGGGMKAFCGGTDSDTPSITNASRPIKPSEYERCLRNGVTGIVEVKIGYDGIVLANSKEGPDYALTLGQIYSGLADELPDGQGGFRENPYTRWNQIDPALPDTEIRVFGPPPTSGTRDAFVEIAMEAGARTYPQLAALEDADPDAFKARAHTIRGDNAYVNSGENDTAIVQTMIKNPTAVGILGFGFLDQNTDRVKGIPVGGIIPTFEAISSGDYSISRSMYLYVKRQHLGSVPGLRAFLDAYTDEGSWGPDGYLAEKGLIPLPAGVRRRTRDAALGLEAMAPPEG